MKHEIKLKYYGYKYAPESFNFFVNGKLYAAAYTPEAAALANLILQGKEKEARDKIKRELRASYKKPHYITIGFYKAGSKKDYFFTRQLYADNTSLNDKLFIYKEFKKFMENQNETIKTHEVKTGYFIPGQTTPATTEQIEEKADIKRPVIIHLI